MRFFNHQMKAYLARLSDHAHWANARTLAALRGSDPPAEAVRLFAHMLTTEQIYHGRISGLDPWPQDFWPDLSLTACAPLVPANRDRYRRFLDERSDEDLRRRVRYRNSHLPHPHRRYADAPDAPRRASPGADREDPPPKRQGAGGD